jgi:hypothetical protein
VGRGISARSRRAADRALDGPHAHRRLGALYVRTAEGGVQGRLYSGSEQRRGLTLFAAGFFVLAAAGVGALYHRSQRAVQGERVDAYLAVTCAADEARALGVRAHPDGQPDRTAG